MSESSFTEKSGAGTNQQSQQNILVNFSVIFARMQIDEDKSLLLEEAFKEMRILTLGDLKKNLKQLRAGFLEMSEYVQIVKTVTQHLDEQKVKSIYEASISSLKGSQVQSAQPMSPAKTISQTNQISSNDFVFCPVMPTSENINQSQPIDFFVNNKDKDQLLMQDQTIKQGIKSEDYPCTSLQQIDFVDQFEEDDHQKRFWELNVQVENENQCLEATMQDVNLEERVKQNAETVMIDNNQYGFQVQNKIQTSQTNLSLDDQKSEHLISQNVVQIEDQKDVLMASKLDNYISSDGIQIINDQTVKAHQLTQNFAQSSSDPAPTSLSILRRVQFTSDKLEKLNLIQSTFGKDLVSAKRFCAHIGRDALMLDPVIDYKLQLLRQRACTPDKCQKMINDIAQKMPLEAFVIYVEIFEEIDITDPFAILSLITDIDFHIKSNGLLFPQLETLKEALQNFEVQEFESIYMELQRLNYFDFKALESVLLAKCPDLFNKIFQNYKIREISKKLGPEGKTDLVQQILSLAGDKAQNQLYQKVQQLTQFDLQFRKHLINVLNNQFSISFENEIMFLLQTQNSQIHQSEKILNVLSDIQACDERNQLQRGRDARTFLGDLLSDLKKKDSDFFKFTMKFLETKFREMKIPVPKTLAEEYQQSQKIISSLLFQNIRSEQFDIRSYYEIQDFNLCKQEEQFITNYKRNNQELDLDLLNRILFQYIKQRKDINFLIRKIRKVDQGLILTRSILIDYLLFISKTELKILLLKCLAYSQPTPFDVRSINLVSTQRKYENANIEFQLHAVFAIDGFKNVLNFSSQPKQADLLRKTEILPNQAFGKNFESLNESFSNLQTFEVQSDHNLDVQTPMPVVNHIGNLSPVIIEKVLDLFNVFIMHTSSRSRDEREHIERITSILKKKSSPFLYIVLDYKESFIQYK